VTAGAIGMNFFSSTQTTGENKLECLSLPFV
jgi:hypothetical protein